MKPGTKPASEKFCGQWSSRGGPTLATGLAVSAEAAGRHLYGHEEPRNSLEKGKRPIQKKEAREQ